MSHPSNDNQPKKYMPPSKPAKSDSGSAHKSHKSKSHAKSKSAHHDPKSTSATPPASDPDLVRAHNDALADLRKRTAQLVNHYGGDDEQGTRVLDIPESEEEKAEKARQAQAEQAARQAQASQGAAAAIANTSNNHAADVIRNKLDKIFTAEPNAVEEAIESTEIPAKQRSKHQQFMYDLSISGKSLADVQTEWHNYYLSLPDDEKSQV